MTRRIGIADGPAWLGLAASVLALVACYGTLGAIAALSLMGVTLTLNEGAWAGAIVVFALLALAGIGLGQRRHGRHAPSFFALAGTALIVWVMFVQYGRLTELAGFALLVGAAAWDWRLGRASQRKETRHG